MKKANAIRSQFIVMGMPSADQPVLVEQLQAYPQIDILETLDSSTALVSMTARTRNRLAAEHPDWSIEPNITYSKLGSG